METPFAPSQIRQHSVCMEESFEVSGRTYSGIGPTGLQIARSVARCRTDKGLTTEQLAHQLTELGIPIKAPAITKIEKGYRRLTADELTALAVVLGVNVNALLLPVEVDRDRPVEITGQREVPAARAWEWAQGRKPLPGHGADEQAFKHSVRPYLEVMREGMARMREALRYLPADMDIDDVEALESGRKQWRKRSDGAYELVDTDHEGEQ